MGSRSSSSRPSKPIAASDARPAAASAAAPAASAVADPVALSETQRMIDLTHRTASSPSLSSSGASPLESLVVSSWAGSGLALWAASPRKAPHDPAWTHQLDAIRCGVAAAETMSSQGEAGHSQKLQRLLLDCIPQMPLVLVDLIVQYDHDGARHSLPMVVSQIYGKRYNNPVQFDSLQAPVVALLMLGWSVRGIIGFTDVDPPNAGSLLGVQLVYGPPNSEFPSSPNMMLSRDAAWQGQADGFFIPRFPFAECEGDQMCSYFSLWDNEVITDCDVASGPFHLLSLTFRTSRNRYFSIGDSHPDRASMKFSAPDGHGLVNLFGESMKGEIHAIGCVFAPFGLADSRSKQAAQHHVHVDG